MTVEREDFNLVFNKHAFTFIFLIGGLHGNSFINGTVEMYDQLHDNWQVVGTLPTPVYAQGLVCIYKERMKKRPS